MGADKAAEYAAAAVAALPLEKSIDRLMRYAMVACCGTCNPARIRAELDKLVRP